MEIDEFDKNTSYLSNTKVRWIRDMCSLSNLIALSHQQTRIRSVKTMFWTQNTTETNGKLHNLSVVLYMPLLVLWLAETRLLKPYRQIACN